MTPEEAAHLPQLHARLLHLQSLSTRRIGPAMAFFVPFLDRTPTLQFVRCTICTDPLSPELAASIRQKLLNPGPKSCRIRGFVARSSQTAAGGTSSLFNHAHRSHPDLLAALRKLACGGVAKRPRAREMVALSVSMTANGWGIFACGAAGRIQLGLAQGGVGINQGRVEVDVRQVLLENGLSGRVLVVVRPPGVAVISEESCYDGVCIASCLKEGIRGMAEEGGEIGPVLDGVEEWPTLAEAMLGVLGLVELCEGCRGWERLRDALWEVVRPFVEFWQPSGYVISAVAERFDVTEIERRVCRIWGGGGVLGQYTHSGGVGWVVHSCVPMETVWEGEDVLGLLGF